MNWPAIWYHPEPQYAAARMALTPASWLYAFGWTCYRSIYDIGLKRSKQPFDPILCIGNLTVGGSGKTPLTVLIAKTLTSLGHNVIISCSGYGAPKSEGATLAPEGPLKPQVWGDEPTLLRFLLPDVPLIVGRARVQAAAIARSHPGAVLMLDDGFQHLPLKKTASILVDPPSSNHSCLPAGPYREPRSNLKRADVVLGPPDSAFQLTSTITGFERLSDGEPLLAPTEADALCAIGRPQSFFDALATSTNIHIRHSVALPDHDKLEGALNKMVDPVIVTAKDAVKLREMPDALKREVYVARHEVRVEPFDAFTQKLLELIDR